MPSELHRRLPEAGPMCGETVDPEKPIDGCWANPKGKPPDEPRWCRNYEVSDVGLCQKHLDELRGEEPR